jgi:putative glutamine transport system substrate-binding protein
MLGAALLAGAVLTGCGNAQGERDLAAIKKAGVLKVGVKADVPGFGLQNTATGQYEGFEIELAKLIANEIMGDPSKVAFTTVISKTRGPLIDMGELDMIIATFTVTEERKLTYNFTTPYYTDAVGMLVKKSAGISGLVDLDGKTIGVAQSTTSKEAIETAAKAIGVSPKFAEFSSFPELKTALDSGRIDVFSVDNSILGGYLDSETVILPDVFAPQSFSVTTKLQNKALAAYLDELITKWLADGTIDQLIQQFKL